MQSFMAEPTEFHAERVRMLMGNALYIIVAAHVFSATALLIGLELFGPHPAVWPWWALVMTVTAIRAIAIRRWRRTGVPPDRAPAIAFRFTLLTTLAGMVWGLGAVVFFDPANVPIAAILCVFLVGMATGGMGPLAAYFPAYAAFATTTLLPISAYMFSHDAFVFWFLGTAGVFYCFTCLGASAGLDQRIRESIALRFENRQLITDLEEKRREAERANEAKGRFLAAASHDLRQPLHSLSLAVDMLEMEASGEGREKIVRSIRSSVNATSDLLSGLLDVSRLDAGVVCPEPRSMALQPLFDHLEEVFRPLAQDRKMHIRIRPTNACVYSDPKLLYSVLQNLISNALRYGHQGGHVHVAARYRGSRWSIEVRDNGPGIDPELQERIFEDFSRGENVVPGSGLGLGLAIVRRIARLIGHEIRVRSKPGLGSTFVVEVDKCTESARLSADMARVDHDYVIPDRNEEISVLLLATEPDATHQLMTLLECRGVKVLTARRSEDILEYTGSANHGLDAVIMEGHGQMSELSAVRQFMKEAGKRLPLILITGDTSRQLAQWADSAEVTLLYKPVTRERLYSTISDAMALDL